MTETHEHKTQIAFISGHIDISRDHFLIHYRSRLDAAVAAGHDFIISDAKGADSIALEYLIGQGVAPSRITIYLHSPKKSNSAGNVVAAKKKFEERGLNVEIVEGSHTDRDAVMTAASGYDVLYVRPEEETKALYGAKYRAGRVSGTQKNRERREKMESSA